MKDQINTIREALLDARSLLHDGRRQDKALTALDQIEKMVGSQVPVAWGMQHTDGAILDVISPEEHAREEGGYVVPLYRAAPVAQQPPKLEDIEQYRLQMAGISTAAIGYWKEGDSIHPDYDTPALRDVAKLYAKYDELYKAQQPQAEVVWVNPELEHMAEEAECVSMCLNDMGVPSKDGSKPLSLWGRVQQYANPRFLEGMTTNAPIVSSEHIKALAQVCRLIGNYTTAEFVQNVVGFAQVLLANKAVQEAFVKANTHLLYAAPQQAEAVPMKTRRVTYTCPACAFSLERDE